MCERILGLRLGAVLSEEEGFEMFARFVCSLEKESWGALAAVSSI